MKLTMNHHIPLFGILLIMGILIGCTSQTNELDDHQTESFEISPEALNAKLQHKEEIILLDVREDIEYAEEHIENAASPTKLLSVNALSLENLEKLGLQKDDEIIVYCRSGKRSANAYTILQSFGYTNIKSLAGGIIHWKEEGFAVASGEYTPEIVKDNLGLNSGAKISFDTTSKHLGKISKGNGVATTTFTIKNIGTADLEISDISTSCGCTTAEVSEETISPHQEATLTVHFDPNFHDEPLGKFTRTVFIETNDKTLPEAEVNIVVEEVIE